MAPTTTQCAMMRAITIPTKPVYHTYWVRRYENSLAIPQARITGRPLTLVDTHVRGASPTDPTGGSGITGVPTLPLTTSNATCWGMPHQC
nr:MAG TPA: hypothetical protein [Caudoviricetes sp.]